MSRILPIGVLGCSAFAKRSFIQELKNSGLFELKAIASRSLSKAETYAQQFNCDAVGSYEALLQRTDIEVVYMPLPIGIHTEWLMKALQAGKHVLVEKSFTSNIDDTKAILALAKEKSLCVFENFMFPFHSQMTYVQNELAHGTIGQLQAVRSSFGFPMFDATDNIRYKKELGGGALLDAGAYTLLAAQLFLGKRLQVVGAVLNNDGHEVDFNDHVLLQNEQGICAQLSFGFNHFYQNNIELWGTTGKIVMKRAFTAAPGFAPTVEIEKPDGITSLQLPADNHFQKLLQQFYRSILEQPDWQFAQIEAQSALITAVFEKANQHS